VLRLHIGRHDKFHAVLLKQVHPALCRPRALRPGILFTTLLSPAARSAGAAGARAAGLPRTAQPIVWNASALLTSSHTIIKTVQREPAITLKTRV